MPHLPSPTVNRLARPGRLGVNGTLLDDDRLSWAVTSAYDDTSHSTNSASLGYLGQYGNLYTGYAYSKNHRQASSESERRRGGTPRRRYPLRNRWAQPLRWWRPKTLRG
ncbi:fimbria/pilus outer membrane usher protein [Klebsiella pneumoniae subsp. pneumoniae]|nr:fimbria/pilus outer membrane usher protein [Klebsiella pneumoniae subsp. pneumoniae]